MTDCPPRLRGDLSKWLCEINIGVYVGHVSGRVRDAIWDRVCQNLKSGRATMVFSTNNEQKLDFRVHNSAWSPVNFDGVTLMRRPLPQTEVAGAALKPGFSKAAKRQIAQRRTQLAENLGYIVFDLETTGLDPASDEIVEFGALRVENGAITETFSRLVRCEKPLPQQIASLTGITDALLQEQGLELEKTLGEFLDFIGHETLIGYNLFFDMNFLRKTCRQFHQSIPTNRCVDLLQQSRRKVSGVANFKLTTLAAHFSLPAQNAHRALDDCMLAHELYLKLKEF